MTSLRIAAFLVSRSYDKPWQGDTERALTDALAKKHGIALPESAEG